MINIRSYISKDLVFGAIGGSILGTIIAGLIDGKALDESNKELELSNEQLEKAAENLEKFNSCMSDMEEVVKTQGLRIQELENELKKYDNEDFKEWMSLKISFNLNKEAFSDYLIEKRRKEQKEKEEAEVKKAIKEKDWTTVYNKAERWYNKYPVQMSRSEVFTNLEKDGYITQEERTEAYNYFGSLWNYVGD